MPKLQLYDSLTRKKWDLQTLNPQKIGLYVCGVTAYDLCHLGHARTFVAFDVIVRYLRYVGFEVLFVRNITDVDDKIIARAQALGLSCSALSQKMVQEMYRDFDALGLLRPDQEPHATDHIEEMIALIASLIQKSYAYLGSNGDVLFRVSKFRDYGQLSRQQLDQLEAAYRISAEKKEAPADFVLWKRLNESEPEQTPRWASPWGVGRPGWHIECSAMSKHWLGETFDIHGGGGDLRFPHHENEIAQSICGNDKPFARYWMHTGMVTINQDKMSKSLGNFVTIRELLVNHDPEVLRYFLLSGHYRSNLQFSWENLERAHQTLSRLYGALLGEQSTLETTEPNHNPLCRFTEAFKRAMDDDFNTPQALSILFELCGAIYRAKREGDLATRVALSNRLRDLAAILGLLQRSPEEFLQGDDWSQEQIEKILDYVNQRQRARETQDWAQADLWRSKLLEMGVSLEDTECGTLWRRRKTFKGAL